MKKIVAWILLIIMTGTLAACSGQLHREGTAVTAEQREERIKTALAQTGEFLYHHIPEPDFGSVGGEWTVFGLARSGLEIPKEYFEVYFENLAAYAASQNGKLHDRKYTEYSRVILAVTAMGADPADVGGYNMLLPLADFDQTVFQGINGPVFALLALDSGNYEIPETAAGNTQATRDMYVDYILNAQLSDGGWALAGDTAEIDLTAMALQALAGYQDRKDAAEAIEQGLQFLSGQQDDQGGYTVDQAQSSESVSQTMVALAELDISLEDPRFVKQGNTLLDALLQFQQEDGSFSHLLDGETDLLSTEQAFYALAAMDRRARGESSLYTVY